MVGVIVPGGTMFIIVVIIAKHISVSVPSAANITVRALKHIETKETLIIGVVPGVVMIIMRQA